MRFVIAGQGAALWHEARDLVQDVYAHSFGASQPGTADAFIVAQHAQTSRVGACVGVNFGRITPFAVEHHLPVSAEEVVTIHLGQVRHRHQIVEFGPLAAADHGSGRAVLRRLPGFARANRKSCALFTATAQVVGLIRYLGLPFEPIARARAEQLPVAQRSGWGRYFEHEPVIGLTVAAWFTPPVAGPGAAAGPVPSPRTTGGACAASRPARGTPAPRPGLR